MQIELSKDDIDNLVNSEGYWRNKFINLTFALAGILASSPNKMGVIHDIELYRHKDYKDIEFEITRDELNHVTYIKLVN